ncbi:MAG: DPP IV N-terminal domain-containing protein [Steroidobacteraceae bacterium]|nr:DPP IV N-terminal domain-containing protein [Steroidobacteraceae bacterium]MDW8258930.1 DPP IV N-terminal domain-containing protein [Gammaproteobacteria bacterium]
MIMRLDLLAAAAAAAIVLGCAANPPGNAPSPVTFPPGAAISTRPGELPSWQIPNIGEAAEAYYGPDSTYLIAQVQSPLAIKSARGMAGFLTQTFTDAGTDIVQINDKGWDACSYFFPDGQRLIWTSVKDNLDMELGNWSDWRRYPQGAELYVSDRRGGNVRRLTHNRYYEAEVTVSPDGKWIVFGRQINGNMDLWVMKSDGTEERQITFTEDDQEGAPYFLPDSETILYRAWKASEYDQKPTPMTIYTIKRDGTGRTPRTFTHDMNWAPYPAPDGRHFVFVRAETPSNWEVYLGDLQSREIKRLTFDEGFDGFPALSPDGRKMVWTSSRMGGGRGFMSGLRLHVMDVSSLNLGPRRR